MGILLLVTGGTGLGVFLLFYAAGFRRWWIFIAVPAAITIFSCGFLGLLGTALHRQFPRDDDR